MKEHLSNVDLNRSKEGFQIIDLITTTKTKNDTLHKSKSENEWSHLEIDTYADFIPGRLATHAVLIVGSCTRFILSNVLPLSNEFFRLFRFLMPWKLIRIIKMAPPTQIMY
jgi:hypothetical protein